MHDVIEVGVVTSFCFCTIDLSIRMWSDVLWKNIHLLFGFRIRFFNLFIFNGEKAHMEIELKYGSQFSEPRRTAAIIIYAASIRVACDVKVVLIFKCP